MKSAPQRITEVKSMGGKDGMDRRSFMRKGALAVALSAAPIVSSPRGAIAGSAGKFATLIDLTKCDGCAELGIPKCVEACRRENASRFPEPRKPIRDLWPQKTHDDWSEKKDVTDKLTPYNWITVQKVQVDGQTLHIPRRCMHCDNPPCANLCPFGALRKYSDGAVVIDHASCLGGAKCKSVCPWQIPQRQSGVGIYLKLHPIPAGGGVMYKCDLCHSRLEKGLLPACIEACKGRKGEEAPMILAQRQKIAELAGEAKRRGFYTYGEKENGGTATVYLSRIPFEKINSALSSADQKPHMARVEPKLMEANRWSKGFIFAPLGAALGALGLVLARRANGKEEK